MTDITGVWLGIAIGVILGVLILTVVVLAVPPDGLTPNRLRGCELAGYSSIVLDIDKNVYCVDVEDLVRWWEE